jgi:rhodanese-related sulfurtransferase
MCTSNEHIYAVGDCAEQVNRITGKPVFIPLGSTANKQGRVAANHICGIEDRFDGVLGSSVCQVFDFSVARTGLNEKMARDLGYDVETILCAGPDLPHFMPEAKPIFLKLIADKASRRLLGAQGTGPGQSQKRIDVAAMAILGKLTVDDLAQADLCYAPPFSPAMDNIITAGNVMRNNLDGFVKKVSQKELKSRIIEQDESMVVVDVSSPPEYKMRHIKGAVSLPIGQLRTKASELPKDKQVILTCKSSLRGYEASMILKGLGYKNVFYLDGGNLFWDGPSVSE